MQFQHTLITLDNTEDHNYEKIIRPVGMHCRILEQKEIKKNNMPLHPSWTINNITCYEGENATRTWRKNNTKANKKEKEVHTDGSKTQEKK